MKLNKMTSQGQSLVEYSLVLALIAAASIGGLHLLGGNLATQFSQIAISLVKSSPSSGSIAVSASAPPNSPVPAPNISTAIANPNCNGSTSCATTLNDASNW